MRSTDIQLHAIRYTHSYRLTSLPSTGDGKLKSVIGDVIGTKVNHYLIFAPPHI